jgi:hypothetical protein
MRIEIILDEADLLGIRKVLLGQVFQRMSVVGGGTLVGDFDMSPPDFRSSIGSINCVACIRPGLPGGRTMCSALRRRNN